MVLLWYISGHGYGHASRDLEVIAALRARVPGCRVVVRTAVDPAFIALSGQSPAALQRADVDTGVAQIDSLTPDEIATARQAAAFYRDFERRIDAEAAVIRELDASLVVGDIPPLAFAAAPRAGVPSVAFGNFTWDWIYGDYPRFEALAPGVLALIRDAYARATLALRLPLHGGFESIARVHDIPLVARRSERGRDAVRQTLGLASDALVVLPSFGGFGLDLPYDTIARRGDFELLQPDWQRMSALGLRYEDLVAASDVVVSKPGYGIVSECIANGTALLYTSRGRFIEQDMFVAEMPNVLRCRFIAQEALKAGDWTGAIDAVLALPAPPQAMAIDGAAVAAGLIASLC